MARNFTNVDTDKLQYANIQTAQAQAQTFSAWVYVDTLTQTDYIFSILNAGEPETKGIQIQFLVNEVVRLYVFADTNMYRKSDIEVFNVGELFHLLVTWDGSITASNIHFYINNSEVSYDTSQNGVAPFGACDGTWSLGSQSIDAFSLDGKMSNVGWWNRVLTTAERTMLANRFSPRFIPNGLKFAPDLVRGVGDPISGKVGSLTGTAVSPHPRIIQPCGVL